MRRILLAGLIFSGMLAAQSIQVYSEFRRVDPYGEIVPQDRGGRPREILSPLLARNSHALFHLVVEVPPGKLYYLYVGTNPKDVFRIRVYKEMYQLQGTVRVPDRLLPVTLPYMSHIPDRYHGLSDQKVESFLVDVFVPADVADERIKLEPQVNVDGHWVTYPMEVRISKVAAPPFHPRAARLPSVREPADASALGPLRDYLCGESEKETEAPMAVRSLIRRDALEDMAIAKELEKRIGKEAVAKGLLRGLGISRDAFCATGKPKSPLGPEWYLKGRDFLYRSEPD